MTIKKLIKDIKTSQKVKERLRKIIILLDKFIKQDTKKLNKLRRK